MRHARIATASGIAALLIVAATPAVHAQQAAAPPQPQAARATIDPGLTKAQVVERFGKPAIERSRGTFTYLF